MSIYSILFCLYIIVYLLVSYLRTGMALFIHKAEAVLAINNRKENEILPCKHFCVKDSVIIYNNLRNQERKHS